METYTPPTPTPQRSTTSDAVALRTALRGIGRSWPIIVGAAILAVAGAVAFSSTQPSIYSASASLVIGDASYQQVVAGGYNPVDAQRRLRTNADLVQLPMVARRASRQLEGMQGVRREGARVEPVFSQDSNTMRIVATARDGRSAAALANATAHAFLDYRKDLSGRALNNTRKLLREQTRLAPTRSERRALVAKRNNLEALKTLDDQQVQIVQLAIAPARATNNNTVRTGLIALVLGTLVGIAISLLRIREPERLVDPWADNPPSSDRRRRRLPLVPAAVLLILAAGAVAGFLVLRAHDADRRRMQAAAAQFADAWERGATPRMWELLGPRTRAEVPRARFAASYGAANRAATVSAVRVGPIPAPSGDRVRLPVTVRTRLFGTLRGTVTLPLVRDGKRRRIAWTPDLRLPGLRAGERVRRRVGPSPRRASVLDAAGRRLDREPATAAIAGRPPSAADRGSGLERLYDARLSGRPSTELRFGRRVIARVPGHRGHPVRATIRPGLQRAAVAALGGRLGGVAVVRPRDGAVLALAGLAVSAPQPPGSTFKIVTVAAALQAGIVKPTNTYPMRTSVTLSGVRLRNAHDEACGGSLTNALTISCNAVFAPIGARLGAKRLAKAAERFGFNQVPRVPSAVASRFPAARDLRDSLAVGAAAIGQDRDLATPLQMAVVGATIANRGVHAAPRIARSEKVVRRRAVRARVARQVREMMRSVVGSGTGTAAAMPGVDVAGKTGTAELRPTADAASDPKNTDAWFVAFAPAGKPRVAVAVLLVGAGAGGSAAPVARQMLQAAL